MIVKESEMNFGDFDDDSLFYIERSNLYQKLGPGFKTVELVIKDANHGIIFLKAKKSCPNKANYNKSSESKTKFEEYYSSVTEKFITSLQIYLAAILGVHENTTEIGEKLRIRNNSLKDMELKFVLVIKDAADEEWLAGPRQELNSRLRQIQKIWKIKVLVLNESLAQKYHLVCSEQAAG